MPQEGTLGLARRHLYRGTTPDWPGNEGLREAGCTPATTDPLVATLFAVLCRNHGASVALLVDRSSLEPFVGPANFFGEVGCAVNLRMQPSEFFRYVVRRVEVDRALEVLSGMGFDRLPVRLRSPEALRDELFETQELRQRLSPAQVAEFDRQVQGE